MKCLVALDFKTCKGKVSDEQGEMAAVAVKIPVLNNMALCLFKSGKHERAIQMLD
jgi:hypothetical protein